MTFSPWRRVSNASQTCWIFSRIAILKTASFLSQGAPSVSIAIIAMLTFFLCTLAAIIVSLSAIQNSDLFLNLAVAHVNVGIASELVFSLLIFGPAGWAIFRAYRALPTALTSAVHKMDATEKRLTGEMQALREARILDQALSTAPRSKKRTAKRL